MNHFANDISGNAFITLAIDSSSLNSSLYLFIPEPAAYQKALTLIAELYDHPQTGTGKPERLKGGGGTLWSRRITQKHRLVYDIFETIVHVNVLSAYGHYDEK